MGVLSVGSKAHADTITQNISYGPTSTDWSHVFTFNQFNPHLGTLNSITWDATLNMNTGGTVTNTSTRTQQFMLTVQMFVDLQSPPHVGGDIMASATVSQSYLLGSGTASAFGQFSTSGNGGVTLTATPGNLAPYIGHSKMPINAFTLTDEVLQGGGGNIASAITTTGAVHGSLVYDFTPRVPEIDAKAAGSVVTLLVGGVCMLRARRRPA
jgi:hypothetical protein